ncbi:MAG: DNA polymerase IV [Actinomycetota bacterium]|nr:DNA polymerase IV [Actinomycetota bacterium]
MASILHCDLDAFFAAVEQLDDPTLLGRPVIVGGLGNRGVVAAASYEARTYGVYSAVPMARARRACPHGVFLSPRFDRYGEMSREVMAILRSVTPLVEPLSIDEAFLDVAGVRRHHGPGPEVAALIRGRVRAETGLTVSVGAATTKFLAKLASDLSKPDGLLVVEPGAESAFLAPLPVTRLWGVGPATFTKLDRMGVATIGDVARLPVDALTAALGPSLGAHLHALAHNDDPRAVVPEHETKSIGAEETFGTDLATRAACDRELVRLAERVAIRLRRAQVVARTLTLKVRFGDFETRTRARTLTDPTDVGPVVLGTARELLEGFDVTRGIRLLGVSASQLLDPPPTQGVLVLDADPEGDHVDRIAAVERAADAVRERFGDSFVRPAALLDRRRGDAT